MAALHDLSVSGRGPACNGCARGHDPDRRGQAFTPYPSRNPMRKFHRGRRRHSFTLPVLNAMEGLCLEPRLLLSAAGGLATLRDVSRQVPRTDVDGERAFGYLEQI